MDNYESSICCKTKEESVKTNDVVNQPGKMSKAAKRREKKAQLQKEQRDLILKSQTENSNNLRVMETSKLEKQLSVRNYVIHAVPSDGDCLYQSIGHQLKLRNYPLPSDEVCRLSHNLSQENFLDTSSIANSNLVKLLRKLTANHIRTNMTDFMPFMFNPDSGESMTQNQFDEYCDCIENTSAWGGQLEVRALSNVLRIPIEILQADCVPVIVGEEFDQPAITIVYHRYAFALGEHYNSCVPEKLKS